MQRRLLLLLAALCALGLAWSAPASAGVYEVQICTPTVHDADGLTKVDEGSSRIFTNICNTASGLDFVLNQTGNVSIVNGVRMVPTGAQRWVLTAPPATSIFSFSGIQELSPGNDWNEMRWRLFSEGPENTLEEASEQTLPVSEPLRRGRSYIVNSTRLVSRFSCSVARCDGFASVSFEDTSALMKDEVAPTVSAGGPLLDGQPAAGGVEVTYEATDRGSGIQTVSLLIDGEPVAESHDSNEGRCAQPFTFLVPCKLALESSFLVDTTKLADGEHTVEVTAADAAREFSSSPPTTFLVRNTPPKRTPPPGDNRGSAGADTTAPTLSAVSVARIRHGRAALVKYASSEAGKLSLRVQRVVKGKPRAFADLRYEIKAPGPAAVLLGRRVAGKRLAPGRYRVLLSVTDRAGNASQPARRAFTILPGRARP